LAAGLLVGCSSGSDLEPRDSSPAPTPAATPDATATAAPGTTPTSPTTGAPDRPGSRAVRARSAAQVARQVLAAERAIADPATAGRELRAAARLQQLAYRVLGTRPGWDDAVYSALPPRLHSVVRDNVAARRGFRSMHTTLSRTLPAWRVVEPEPAEDLLRFYRDAESAYDVGWEYLAAINLVETAMGRIRGTSVAGAQGPMQFIPSTWAAYGEGDVNDPHDAILAAARYLAANGGDSDAGIEGALYRYNTHGGYVAGILAYASILQRDPRALEGLVRWQIVYLSSIGDLWLPVGYREAAPVPVRQYVRQHPERHLSTATS
jgi:membrane-bound lytic murein transglycosylase B